MGERFEAFCLATEKLSAVAHRLGASMTELAIGWVLRLPEVSVALVVLAPLVLLFLVQLAAHRAAEEAPRVPSPW